MANWRKTKTKGVYVAHQRRCPAFASEHGRCRCEPSWRGRRHNPFTGRPEWQKPVTKDRSEVLSWLSAARKGSELVHERGTAERTFESLGDEWLAGVEARRIGRRKGRGKPYSDTTIADYRRAYRSFLIEEFGPMVADEIGEVEWQMWVDQLSREGLSRSRISTFVAVASAIYAWALTPTRQYVTRNPLRLLELPPNDEKPRLRVALATEAAHLLAALTPEDRVPYAIAFYAGGQVFAGAPPHSSASTSLPATSMTTETGSRRSRSHCGKEPPKKPHHPRLAARLRRRAGRARRGSPARDR